nr:hypothetical protein CFP56_17347 [Quercus suber]
MNGKLYTNSQVPTATPAAIVGLESCSKSDSDIALPSFETIFLNPHKIKGLVPAFAFVISTFVNRIPLISEQTKGVQKRVRDFASSD